MSDIQIEKGTQMEKFVIATALAMIGASAHAGTCNAEGVTIHFQDGCRSSSFVLRSPRRIA
jgi:hypothetical protein